jgi:ATP-dependent DNA ligase
MRGFVFLRPLKPSTDSFGHLNTLHALQRLLSRADRPRPPSGFDWIHEIKHDGFRLMARRDPWAYG